MKFILLLILPLIVACGISPVTSIESGASNSGFAAFASLSGSGNVIEQDASVVYTDLARYRYSATALLQQRKITVSRAKKALLVSDHIRAALDKAVKKRQLSKVKQLKQDITRELVLLEAGL